MNNGDLATLEESHHAQIDEALGSINSRFFSFDWWQQEADQRIGGLDNHLLSLASKQQILANLIRNGYRHDQKGGPSNTARRIHTTQGNKHRAGLLTTTTGTKALMMSGWPLSNEGQQKFRRQQKQLFLVTT